MWKADRVSIANAENPTQRDHHIYLLDIFREDESYPGHSW